MKRVLSFLFIVLIVFGVSINACASSDNTITVEYFADGSCIETILVVEKGVSVYGTQYKDGTKKITYKDEDGIVCWKATLTATFRYTGSSATCTDSDVTYTVSNSKWKITSATASKSGNTATADVTAKRYTLGIPVETLNRTITMTCSANGTIS